MQLILALLLSLTALFASGQSAAVEIVSEPGLNEPFFLYINGIKQNEAPTTALRIVNLPFELYAAELKMANKPEQLKKLLFLQIGRVKNYLLTNINNSLNLAEGPYNSDNKITIGVTTLQFKTGTLEYASQTINEELVSNTPTRKSFFDDEEEPENKTQTFSANNKAPQANDTAQLNKPDEKLRINADSLFKALKMKNNSQIISPEPCITTLPNDDLRLLKIKIKETPQLKAKLTIALTNLKQACITCAQLKELMRLLDGDELKLALYKQVYLNISDFYNRSDLYDIFYFENSVDELKTLQ